MAVMSEGDRRVMSEGDQRVMSEGDQSDERWRPGSDERWRMIVVEARAVMRGETGLICTVNLSRDTRFRFSLCL